MQHISCKLQIPQWKSSCTSGLRTKYSKLSNGWSNIYINILGNQGHQIILVISVIFMTLRRPTHSIFIADIPHLMISISDTKQRKKKSLVSNPKKKRLRSFKFWNFRWHSFNKITLVTRSSIISMKPSSITLKHQTRQQ